MENPIFASDQHRAFYETCMMRVRKDCYHKALFYLLGVSRDTRRMADSLFNFADDCIRPEALNAGWQASGSYRLCLLVFHLWNGFEDENGAVVPCELFACSYAPYMLEGIRLRYPEYCTERRQSRERAAER